MGCESLSSLLRQNIHGRLYTSLTRIADFCLAFQSTVHDLDQYRLSPTELVRLVSCTPGCTASQTMGFRHVMAVSGSPRTLIGAITPNLSQARRLHARKSRNQLQLHVLGEQTHDQGGAAWSCIRDLCVFLCMSSNILDQHVLHAETIS